MNESFYDKIPLSFSEIKAALLEARKKKYFKLQHSAYWQELEEKKIKGKQVTNL